MEPSSSPARRRGAIVGAVVLAAGLISAAPFVLRSSYDAQVRQSVAATVTPTTTALPTSTPVLAPTPTATPTPTVTTSAAEAGVVPWADLPADPAGEPIPLPAPTLDPTLLPCTANQLSATAGDQGVTMGQGDTVITIRRVNGAPCMLDDTVTRLSGVTTAGNRESLPTEGLRYRADDGPVDLRGPGDMGNVLLGYFTRCGSEVATDKAGKVFYAPASRPALRDIVLEMRAGGGLHVASGPLDLGCLGQKVQVSRVGTPPYEPRWAPAGLTASMTVPATAAAGRLFDYVVTLTNTSTHTFSMASCPNYAQYFKAPPYVPGDHRLNCAAAHAIPPGQAESFQMRIAAPSGDPPGQQLLVWHFPFGGNDAPAATALVDITSAQ